VRVIDQFVLLTVGIGLLGGIPLAFLGDPIDLETIGFLPAGVGMRVGVCFLFWTVGATGVVFCDSDHLTLELC
jgi:hypothetical protein